ncbi:methyl-accepting chemotaxis protein [Undibacterium sp. SXout7W]|uniref:methyl-accepting chemotaxis protein n=1 Tax=Undibacterium sp. SXout7W TaxID=3413049 RepID=UPI003BF09E09
MKFTSIRTWSVGAKLALATFTSVSALFIVFIAFIDYKFTQQVERFTTEDVTARTQLVASMLENMEDNLERQIHVYAQVFRSQFKDDFSIDTNQNIDINGTPTPVFKSGETTLNLTLSHVDQFEQQTGGIATIFVRKGDEFVRIATSLKKENGDRAIGTELSHESPAYQHALNGKVYVGNITLFGKQYITQYEPVKSKEGKVIGLLFVGSDFTNAIKQVKDKIRTLKIGATGYFYAINANPGKDYGVLMIHTSKEGQSVLESKDSSGHAFIKEMLERKQGVIRYPWINKELGETEAREKLVSFQTMSKWNWLIAGGVYGNEFTKESSALMQKIIVFAIILLLGMGASIYFTLRHRLSLPLRQVRDAATRLAHGDLTVSMNVVRVDEIGQLMTAINGIGQGLTTVVQQVRENTTQILHSAQEIAVGNADLSARTESQASSLEETAASMHELTGTVRQNSESALNANNLVLTTSDIAAKGGGVVSEVMQTMSSIQDSSRKIVDIISVIDGIAFQTNILALNAAVEAARAGEQGRGFAVVATEVRNLAQRSANAAKEIKILIGDSVDKINAGNQLVGKTGDAMNEVVNAVERVTLIMSEISAASREQSSGIEQINQAVAEMDEMTQQNAALVEQAAAGAKNMEDQASKLVKAVSVFKVSDNILPATSQARAYSPDKQHLQLE